MALIKTEKLYVGSCKCCLNEGELKNMWTPYIFEGETEIYGYMLMDCFALSWEQSEDSEFIEQICEICIAKLRSALAFRREVLLSDALVQEYHKNYEQNTVTTIKSEEDDELASLESEASIKIEIEPDYQDVEYLEIDEGINYDELIDTDNVGEYKLDQAENCERKIPMKLSMEYRGKKKKFQYEESLTQVEQLLHPKRRVRAQRQGNDIKEHETIATEGVKRRKWPKKRKLEKEERNITYRQYEEADLVKAVEAVQNKEMSRTLASYVFRVPRQTISFRLKAIAEELEGAQANHVEVPVDTDEMGPDCEPMEHNVKNKEDVVVGVENKAHTPEPPALLQQIPPPVARRRRRRRPKDEGYTYKENPFKRRPMVALSREDRNKTYKQYDPSALDKAVEAVLKKKMSKHRAALLHGVPRKTLTARLLTLGNPKVEEAMALKRKSQIKHKKLLEEIKSILRLTNGVPFKSKNSKYFCVYCPAEAPYFDKPDELRDHTRNNHAGERIKSIDTVMRPHWTNEILKLDTKDLHCVECGTDLTEWNAMFKHLDEEHGVELDEAYTKVIPYVLLRDPKCALCGQVFINYGSLEAHMNAHYSNYICSECGDTFLTELRLKNHEELHKTGIFPCEACGKVFTVKKYMKSHYDNVHNQKRIIYL